MNIIRKVSVRITNILRSTPLGLLIFKRLNREKLQFTCPICKYVGPFADVDPGKRARKHASCPKCGSLERHRLQYLVINRLGQTRDFSNMSILHIAPEKFLRRLFLGSFETYTSADLYKWNVDYQVDLRELPFTNKSYDVVFASHVLEHIKEDEKALSEISRVLKPDGMAIIPVPVVAIENTIEYPRANRFEEGHVRSPGLDYYQKYLSHFRELETFDSNSFPEEYQLFVYEDRSSWPSTMPLRPTLEGGQHIDIVPVCYK